MFHIFRTKKPISGNKSELVGRTSDQEKALEIADQLNRSEIKSLNKSDLKVQGNREVTEVFTTEELKDAGWGGNVPE